MPTATLGATTAEQVLAAFPDQVVRRRVLMAWGMTGRAIDAQIAARRWRGFGQAVVLHWGSLTLHQRRSVALANAGARARLTAFSALSEHGLAGWHRDAVDVLVPAGARITRVSGLAVVTHQVDDWAEVEAATNGRCHRVADAAALAADSLADPRPSVGLLAAVVQQRLQTAEGLRSVIRSRPRQRHRGLLLAALGDIAMGAQALSEIDFAVVCRSIGLPEPRRQAVRTDPEGRRRYLDVEWTRGDGRRIVAEIDGALHMRVDRWWDDQFRQNDVALDRGSVVLRFPSVAVRTRDGRMVAQLRRALA